MALTPDEERSVSEWYSLHMKACPLCGCKDILIETIVAMPELLLEGVGLRSFPAVPIVCRSCGYTILVAATALKFRPPDKNPTRIQ
jgi:predicted nucleic-acid-binding Zn-ribbon protein